MTRRLLARLDAYTASLTPTQYAALLRRVGNLWALALLLALLVSTAQIAIRVGAL